MNPKDQQHRPKMTIIQANPGYTCDGYDVMAWIIEDGAVAGAVTIGGTRYGTVTHIEMTPQGPRGWIGDLPQPARGNHE